MVLIQKLQFIPHIFACVKTLAGNIQFSEQLYNYSQAVKLILQAPLKPYFVNFLTLGRLKKQFHL